MARIENLLDKLDNPQKKFKSIHVGGTSGKGTTAFYIAQLLCNCKLETRNSKLETNAKFKNLKVQNKKNFSDFGFRISDFPPKIGLHISPHLVDIRERMQIFQCQMSNVKCQMSDKLMPMGRFVELANEVKGAVDDIIANQPEKTPSYFEILVAMSFLYFAQEKVDLAVVEVGLGGRLDATNVLHPQIALITNVGLDHTEILGDTVEEIAQEKAGIIKKVSSSEYQVSSKQKGISVVTGARGRALKVIEKAAKSKKSKLINIYTQSGEINPNIRSYLATKLRFDPFSYGLYSAQLECLLLAILAILELGISVDENAVKDVLERQFPGRFEKISESVILDGAHNPDKILSLIDFVRKFRISNFEFQIHVVVAFKKGKDWKAMLDLLLKNLPIKEIIATEYQAVTDTGKGSAVAVEEIAEYIISNFKCQISNVKCIKNSQGAVVEAIDSSYSSSERSESRSSIKKKFSIKSNNNLVLVTGSLYLVGEARTFWKMPEF